VFLFSQKFFHGNSLNYRKKIKINSSLIFNLEIQLIQNLIQNQLKKKVTKKN